MEKNLKFFEKIKEDKTLQEKIKKVRVSAREHLFVEIEKIAKEAGCEVDKETLGKAWEHWLKAGKEKRELSDEDLEKVAGGSWAPACCAGYNIQDCR